MSEEDNKPKYRYSTADRLRPGIHFYFGGECDLQCANCTAELPELITCKKYKERVKEIEYNWEIKSKILDLHYMVEGSTREYLKEHEPELYKHFDKFFVEEGKKRIEE